MQIVPCAVAGLILLVWPGLLACLVRHAGVEVCKWGPVPLDLLSMGLLASVLMDGLMTGVSMGHA